MARKKILKYEGTLIKRDISKWAKDDEKIKNSGKRLKILYFFL